MSTDSILTGLDQVIDEAKLVRSIIKLKDLAFKLKEENPFSDRLIYLNRGIKYFEAKLLHLRSRANRG